MAKHSSVLGDLGAGLRAAGGILNPKVAQRNAQETENQVQRDFAANEARDQFARQQQTMRIKQQVQMGIANINQLNELNASLDPQDPATQAKSAAFNQQADQIRAGIRDMIMPQQQAQQGTPQRIPLSAPQPRKIQAVKDAGGFQRNAATGDRLFPDAQRAPGKESQRRIVKDANGRQRFADSGELVFPDVEENASTFTPEVVEIPGLPEGNTAVRTSPNSVRILNPDTQQETTFFRQEREDGTIGIFQQETGQPPKMVDVLRDTEGNPIKTGVSGRAEDRGTAAAERAAGVQDRFDKGLQQRALKNRVTVENQAVDDFRQDFSGIKEMERGLNTLDTLLATDEVTALDSKAIQNTLSNLLNTSVRAQAELESFKTFGSLGQRIAQSVGRFATGTFTKASLDQVRTLVNRMRTQVVDPSKTELQNFYRARVIDQGGNPDNVVPQAEQAQTERSVSEMTDAELLQELNSVSQP